MNLLRIAAAAALGACLLSCNQSTEAKQEPEKKPTILGPEDIVTAGMGQVLTGPIISGQLEAREQSTIRAQLAGSVTEVRVREGDRVAKGDVLARIHAVSEREAVSSAQSAVETAKTQLTVAERELRRTEALVEAGALAQRDADQARAVVANAQAQVAEAESRLAAAREQLQDSVVRASISGVVSKAGVDSGDVVSVGAELFTIVDPKTLELHASVPAERLDVIQRGAPVEFTVQGFPDKTFHGAITRIVPSADPQTRQIDVYASIPNVTGDGVPGALVAGLYAQGRIATGGEQAVTIPQEAVHSGGTGNYVLKVADGKVTRAQVTVGVEDERTGNVQIVSGVKAGETVLTGAAADLREGTPVEIQRGQQGS